MNTPATNIEDESPIRDLYKHWINAWNAHNAQHNAHDMAALVTEDGLIVGFDGSQMNGRAEVEATLSQIFADHVTAPYIGIVRSVHFLAPDVALLAAVVGMVPPGQTDINPPTNAIQSLVATRMDGQWRMSLFQNTPAAFHGRPDLSEQLTAELRAALKASPISL